jgi:uncharacterized membrane protein
MAPMAVFLGLMVALTYGTADFFGGVAASFWPTTRVLTIVQCIGLALMTGYLVVFRPAWPSGADALAGSVGGILGLIGIALHYRALALGPMRLVAPIAGVGSAVIPVGIAFAVGGERPGTAAWVGVGASLVALWILGYAEATDDTSTTSARGPLLAAAAGACFGLFFSVMASVSEDSGLWPVFLDRFASLLALGLFVALVRPNWKSPATATAGAWWWIIGCGIFDVAAHAFYVAGGRVGLTSEVSVLSALYPAVTVVLAVIVLRERLRRGHLVGVALAIVGVALIAVG